MVCGKGTDILVQARTLFFRVHEYIRKYVVLSFFSTEKALLTSKLKSSIGVIYRVASTTMTEVLL